MLKFTLNISLICISCFWMNQVSAQISSDIEWTEVIGGFSSYYSKRYTYDSVSVLKHGNEYYEVLSSDFEEGGNWKPTGIYLRYADHRFWYANNTEEFVIFDFTLNVKDVFHTPFGPQLIVASVDTIVLENGESRRRLGLTCDEDDPISIYWIDDLGSTTGIANHQYACVFDYGAALLCYWRNDTLLYDNPEFGSCWENTISTEELRLANISYYPSPVGDELQITDPDQHISDIKIFDIKGQLFFDGKDLKIETSRFAPGLYTVQFNLKDGRSITEKIIKK